MLERVDRLKLLFEWDKQMTTLNSAALLLLLALVEKQFLVPGQTAKWCIGCFVLSFIAAAALMATIVFAPFTEDSSSVRNRWSLFTAVSTTVMGMAFVTGVSLVTWLMTF